MNKKIISIISAFIFSVIIWGSVSLSNSYLINISVPLKLLGMPHGYTSGARTVKEINIRLKGDGWKLASIMLSRNLEFIVPAGLDSGRRFIRLNDAISENTWLTQGIQVYDIAPDTLSFRIEKIRQKLVRIYSKLNLEFKPEFGRTSDIRIEPDTVLIFGTRSTLKNLDSIPTVNKSIFDLESSFSDRIELAQLEGISYKYNYCNVSFDVQRIADKKFEDIPVKIQNIPQNQDLILFPNSINITLRGGINTLGKMKADEIQAYLEFQSAATDSTGSVEPVIITPGYMSIVDIVPPRLKYIIKKY